MCVDDRLIVWAGEAAPCGAEARHPQSAQKSSKSGDFVSNENYSGNKNTRVSSRF